MTATPISDEQRFMNWVFAHYGYNVDMRWVSANETALKARMRENPHVPEPAKVYDRYAEI